MLVKKAFSLNADFCLANLLLISQCYSPSKCFASRAAMANFSCVIQSQDTRNMPRDYLPPKAGNISTIREGPCACRKWLLLWRRQGRGQLSATQYTAHTLNTDSTKHCFLPPKIAGEEMASKILKTRVAGLICTTSEFKACDPPPGILNDQKNISQVVTVMQCNKSKRRRGRLFSLPCDRELYSSHYLCQIRKIPFTLPPPPPPTP